MSGQLDQTLRDGRLSLAGSLVVVTLTSGFAQRL
jgi:hypothetical protein